jgi:hypothetical protein
MMSGLCFMASDNRFDIFKRLSLYDIAIKNPSTTYPPFLYKCLYQVRVITVFTVFRLLTDFVCSYTYEFLLSLCKIVRSSVIMLLPLHTI